MNCRNYDIMISGIRCLLRKILNLSALKVHKRPDCILSKNENLRGSTACGKCYLPFSYVRDGHSSDPGVVCPFIKDRSKRVIFDYIAKSADTRTFNVGEVCSYIKKTRLIQICVGRRGLKNVQI